MALKIKRGSSLNAEEDKLKQNNKGQQSNEAVRASHVLHGIHCKSASQLPIRPVHNGIFRHVLRYVNGIFHGTL